MPRKNHRAPDPTPVDMDPDVSEVLGVRIRAETREERDQRIRAEFARRRERNNARADRRIAAAVDWNKCCIPGCGEKAASALLRAENHPSRRLPICTRHEVIIRKQTEPYWSDPDHIEMRQRFERQRVEADIRMNERIEEVDENGANAPHGQIYFIRLNGLVKVGWSKKLRSRLKSYGASAEVLCHYPASRKDETLLHRQLRPYLAMGHEWYQDCKLINDVVAKTIERHGQPTILPTWTTPKPDVICTRSA